MDASLRGYPDGGIVRGLKGLWASLSRARPFLGSAHSLKTPHGKGKERKKQVQTEFSVFSFQCSNEQSAFSEH
jgi:hypothetical protein